MAQLVSPYGDPINAAATVSGTTSAATRTITAPVGGHIRLNNVVVYASAASNATITITVDGVVVMDFGTIALTTAAQVFACNLTARQGKVITINIGAGSAGTTTTTHSAEVY